MCAPEMETGNKCLCGPVPLWYRKMLPMSHIGPMAFLSWGHTAISPGREIIKALKDLSYSLASSQGAAVGMASGCPVWLATNPPGGIKIWQRMKLKCMKYNLCTTFSKTGVKWSSFCKRMRKLKFYNVAYGLVLGNRTFIRSWDED